MEVYHQKLIERKCEKEINNKMPIFFCIHIKRQLATIVLTDKCKVQGTQHHKKPESRTRVAKNSFQEKIHRKEYHIILHRTLEIIAR